MRWLPLLLLTACSSPFQAALERPDAESAPDAPSERGDPAQDGGGDGDAAGEAEAGQASACVSYYRAFVTNCTCRPTGGPNCAPLQYSDAGCSPSDFNRCGGPGGACGWDGGAQDYAALCACIAACMGSCAPTGASYFACAVGNCDWQSCP